MEPDAETAPAQAPPGDVDPGLVPVRRPALIEWTGVETVPINMANQFLAQVDALGDGTPDQIVLSIGQLLPPPVFGSVEERTARIEQMGAVRVVPLARYSITRARLAELADLLQKIKDHLEVIESGEVREIP